MTQGLHDSRRLYQISGERVQGQLALRFVISIKVRKLFNLDMGDFQKNEVKV